MEAISRRAFLKKMSLCAAALPMMRWLSPDYLKAARAQNIPLAAVAAGENSNPTAEILKLALDGIGGISRFVRPGMKVVIKPNATWAYPPRTASSTDPELLRDLIRLVKDAGAGQIQVVDHCSIDPGSPAVLRVNGIAKIVKEEDVEGIFPDRTNAPLSTYTSIELPDGIAFNKLGVIKAAVEADLRINLALAKSHNVTKMTMCLKHMMGFLQSPGLLHANLEQGIADLSTDSPIKAELHILEAIRVRLPYKTYRVCAGPETDETNPNVVKRVNQIIAGTDPVLIDSYGCGAFFDMLPEELTHVLRASEAGLGEKDCEAAISSGQFLLLDINGVKSNPTTVSPTLTSIVEPQPVIAGEITEFTPTPRPTATQLADGASEQPVGIDARVTCETHQVLDPTPILGTALIPAAMIAAGAGLVAVSWANRQSKQPDQGPQTSQDNKDA